MIEHTVHFTTILESHLLDLAPVLETEYHIAQCDLRDIF